LRETFQRTPEQEQEAEADGQAEAEAWNRHREQQRSAHYPASRIRFTRIPAAMHEVGYHTVPERVLTVRLEQRSQDTHTDQSY
jgi:hypothetical protein